MECLIISLPNSSMLNCSSLKQWNIQSVLSQTMVRTQLFLSQQLNTQLFLSQALNHSIIQVNAVEKLPLLAVLSNAVTRAIVWLRLALLESGKFMVVNMILWDHFETFWIRDFQLIGSSPSANQAKKTRMVFPLWILLLVCQVRACMLNSFSHVQLFGTLWTVAHQAPLSLGFSRQEYWSGLPFPSPVDLPNPGIKLTSLLRLLRWQVESLTLSPPGKRFLCCF